MGKIERNGEEFGGNTQKLLNFSTLIEVNEEYNANILCYMRSGWVTLRIQVKAVSGTNTYCYIPEGYRPRGMTYGFYGGNATDKDKFTSCVINTNGNVQITASSDFSSSQYITMIYPCDSDDVEYTE